MSEVATADRELPVQPTFLIDLGELFQLVFRVAGELVGLAAMSASSVSRCELTEPNSPAAIESAPATSAAIPATSIADRSALAATTPMSRLAVETMPSCAPSTAARSHPTRSRR